MSYLSRSNTSTPAVWAWRKRSWKRVQTCSLCAMPCLCTPRPQTSSSGSLSSRRALKVRLQTATHTHTHTHTHTLSHSRFKQFHTKMLSVTLKELRCSFLLLLGLMELNGIMRLNRITCLQCWKKMFNSLLQWITVAKPANAKLLFASTGFSYTKYIVKCPQLDFRILDEHKIGVKYLAQGHCIYQP